MDTKFRTYYMDSAVFDLPDVIETAKKALAGVDFDTLVGTGFSGSIVIPSIALALGKNFVLIRKETDDSHHGKGRLVGQLGKKWIFVDDFVATGRTRQRVIDKIDEAIAEYRQIGYTVDETELVGQYMYVNYDEKGPQFEPEATAKRGYLW